MCCSTVLSKRELWSDMPPAISCTPTMEGKMFMTKMLRKQDAEPGRMNFGASERDVVADLWN